MGQVQELSSDVSPIVPDNAIEDWYRKNSGCTLDRKKYSYILGRMGSDIKALVLYSDYTYYSITMDICAPKALTKNLIKSMFSYPFNQLRVKKLFGYIDARNVLSQETFKRLGCREIARIPSFFGDNVDRLVYEATREDVVKWVT